MCMYIVKACIMQIYTQGDIVRVHSQATDESWQPSLHPSIFDSDFRDQIMCAYTGCISSLLYETTCILH